MTTRATYIRSQRGFTLVETMITLAVLGIMVGISIPSVMAWMPSMHMKNAAQEIKTAMMQARSKAINHGTEYRVLFSPSGRTYQVDRGNLMNDATQWTTELGPYQLGGNVTFNRFTPQMEKVGADPFTRFKVNGSVKVNVDTLSVQLINSHNDTYRVNLQRRTGHAKLQKGG